MFFEKMKMKKKTNIGKTYNENVFIFILICFEASQFIVLKLSQR